MTGRIGRRGFAERRAAARRLLRAGVLAAAAALAVGPLPGVAHAAEAAEPPTSFVKERKFNIPVRVNPKKAPSVKELRLYSSSDGGQTWGLKKASAPTVEKFTFRAVEDGEFWFTLAFVDRDDAVDPPDVKTAPPGLRVVVDTQAPTVSLTPLPPGAGKAGVAWKVRDGHPDVRKLKLEIRSAGAPQWTELDIRKAIEGEIDWPTDAGDTYTVRATVADRSGNVGTATLAVPAAGGPETADTTGGPGPKPVPTPVAPVEGDGADAVRSMVRDQVADMNDGPPRRFGEGRPLPVARDPSADPRGGKQDTGDEPAAPRPAVAGRPSKEPAGQDDMANGEGTDAPPAPRSTAGGPDGSRRKVFDPTKPALPADPVERPVEVATKAPPKAAEADEEPAPAPPKGRKTSRSRKATGPIQQVAAEEPAEAERPAPPPVKRMPLVNSKTFELDYELAGVGAAGLGAVELYLTKDNGKTWERGGEDFDLTPPIDVEVPGEGRYGLAVVCRSKGGYGQRPPKPGDRPQIEVEVDLHAPKIELKTPKADDRFPGQAMLLEWQTSDAHLSEASVDLFFSPFPEGPWYSINEGGKLPPSGQHSWMIPDNIPHQVFLRVVSTDLCGNSDKVTTKQPVLIDLSSPAAKALKVRASLKGDKKD